MSLIILKVKEGTEITGEYTVHYTVDCGVLLYVNGEKKSVDRLSIT
jgi:hypothetical protein